MDDGSQRCDEDDFVAAVVPVEIADGCVDFGQRASVVLNLLGVSYYSYR